MQKKLGPGSVFISFLAFFITGALLYYNLMPISAGETLQLPHPEQSLVLRNNASGLVLSIYKHSNGKLSPRLGKTEETLGTWRTMLLSIQPAGAENRVRISGGAEGPYLISGREGSIEVSSVDLPEGVWRLTPDMQGGLHIVSDASGRALTCIKKDKEGASLALAEVLDSQEQSWSFMPIAGAGFLAPRERKDLKSVPIVDVHVHVASPDSGASFLGMREYLLKVYNVDMAAWISLSANIRGPSATSKIRSFREKTGGRFFTAIKESFMVSFKITPEGLEKFFSMGVAGFKMWWGNSKGIDAPENDPVYAKMAELGLPVASAHIGKHPKSPEAVEAFAAWSRVMKRHPRLKAVTAHMGNQMYRNDPFTEIEAMMKAHPNFYVDTSWSMNSAVLSDRERLRNLFIRRSDRILFGSDIGSGAITPDRYEYIASNYEKVIRFLETDEWIQGPQWLCGNNKVKVRGLALPKEVLENIYYKNAARIYPGLADGLRNLGYSVDMK